MRFTRFILAPILLVACAQSETAQQGETQQQADSRIAEESRVARAEIEAVGANLSRWLSTGAVDSAAASLTTDYRWHAPNMPAGSGRENWVAWVKGMITTSKVTQASTTESVVASGPIAVESGRYVLTFTPAPGAPKDVKASTDTGKYLWQWRKENGVWRLAQASWNSDLAAKP